MANGCVTREQPALEYGIALVMRINTADALNRMVKWLKLEMALEDGLAAYQLVGEVTAHQGYDG